MSKNLNLRPQLASAAWFSLWSAGSPSPLRSAGPQWPAVGEKREISEPGPHMRPSITHTPQRCLIHPSVGHIGPPLESRGDV